MVDRSGRPAYLQVAEHLREQIRTGRFPPGARLPSYEALMKRYQGAITVVRSAVRQLKTEGLVHSHQGKGVTVRHSPVPSAQAGGKQDCEVFCALAELRTLRDRLARLDERLAHVERVVRPAGC